MKQPSQVLSPRYKGSIQKQAANWLSQLMQYFVSPSQFASLPFLLSLFANTTTQSRLEVVFLTRRLSCQKFSFQNALMKRPLQPCLKSRGYLMGTNFLMMIFKTSTSRLGLTVKPPQSHKHLHLLLVKTIVQKMMLGVSQKLSNKAMKLERVNEDQLLIMNLILDQTMK